MAKLGILPPLDDMFGPGGQRHLDEVAFSGTYAIRIASLRDLLEIYRRELAMIERVVARHLWGHVGYRAVQAINGVGPVMAAIFWQRSATSPASRVPGIFAHGQGSRPHTANRISRSLAATSPNGAATSCAGPPPKPLPVIGHSGPCD
jgi:hypothetical protein